MVSDDRATFGSKQALPGGEGEYRCNIWTNVTGVSYVCVPEWVRSGRRRWGRGGPIVLWSGGGGKLVRFLLVMRCC